MARQQLWQESRDWRAERAVFETGPQWIRLDGEFRYERGPYLRGAPPGEVQPAGGLYSARVLALSALGKSAGTFCVTLPVAAHSAPR